MSLIVNSERRCIFVKSYQDIVVEALDIWKRRAKRRQVFIIVDLLKAVKDNLLNLWLADKITVVMADEKKYQIKCRILRNGIQIKVINNMNKNAICIFTCNNSTKLRSVVTELCAFNKAYCINIIDDSSEFEIVQENIAISQMFDSTTYLGRVKFIEFYNLKENTSTSKQYLGNETWNLGIARNFALDYSIRNQYDKALFIDDDISEINQKIVHEGFSILNKDNFVSCNIGGVEDNSIIGHISKQLKIIEDNPKMLSGGFLFLVPPSISHHFYNIYNEDWIMQFLEHDKERILMPFFVKHDAEKNVKWNMSQVFFQEIGEIVVDGLIINKGALLMDSIFWDNIIKNRTVYIEYVKQCAQQANRKEYYDICSNLSVWLNQINGQSILETIKQNRYGRTKFKI